MEHDLMNLVITGGINLTYAIMCIIVGIISMVVGYKLFDRLTPFNTAKILEKDPIAVGIFNGAIVLGISLASSIIIGLACN